MEDKLLKADEVATMLGVSQSFIHQVRILSCLRRWKLNRQAGKVAILYSSSQNSLATSKAVFHRYFYPESQSFIHQVRILLEVPVLEGGCREASCRNPLFIKSEFSLFITSYADVEATLKRRNPLFIKSEFSQAVRG